MFSNYSQIHELDCALQEFSILVNCFVVFLFWKTFVCVRAEGREIIFQMMYSAPF